MPLNYNLFLQKVTTFSAPTLMHMKVGSLFCVRKKEFPDVSECLTYFRQCYAAHDIDICVLRECQERCLIYVYHYERLVHLLQDQSIRAFLSMCHYDLSSVHTAIHDLKKRLKRTDFPHEIGVFLGYPLYDVKMFIHDTSSFKCVGCWKVYGNKKNALKKFHRYECCTREMTRRLQQIS